MENERFLRKLHGCWEFYKQGRDKEKLGINPFRVLTTCISMERAEDLRQAAKKVDDIETGSVMF